MHYNQFNKTVNIADFNGSYTLSSLRPFTTYKIYVTAVTLINGTGAQLEGLGSEVVTIRTLAGSKYRNFSKVTGLHYYNFYRTCNRVSGNTNRLYSCQC